jgi:RNA polymerase sigma-70 factor (ECF subfamily)
VRFSQVYEEHVWRVYGFLAYRLGSRESAEDLTQATFERALRAWSRYDPRRGPVGPWLLSIAGNLLIDHRRRDRSTPYAEIDERLLPTAPGPDEQPGASDELIDALSQLGEREREVVALRYGGDLSGPEIAALLGLTVGNVQQINSRALRRLRGLLEPEYPADLPARPPAL